MRTRLRPWTTALLIAAGLTATSLGTATAAPPAPVPRLDLDRYLGVWHQLAAVPQVFNLNCARDTSATYTLDPGGDIAVHNRCHTWTGGVDEIRGTATVNDPITNAQLHVSFPGVIGQDERVGPTNYIVTALGPDYSWALVTSPNRLSGFVLSRTPALDDTAWQQIDEAIVTAGQDRCIYLTSPTTGGRSGVLPLCAR
ncbi:lipocalin family protein [Nocardia sp. IBHARD005]|uniref:lipocalin family protein n=1 Tax=Nocardia sp. IBHARD005 TaxID=3457765 RepID=UPI00405A0FFE